MYWNKKIHVNIESFHANKKFSTTSQINIYIDGSKVGSSVGSDTIVCSGNKIVDKICVRLPDNSMVFFAELEAIKQSANIMRELKIADNKYVKFFVDSQAALSSCTCGGRKVCFPTRNLSAGKLNQTTHGEFGLLHDQS